LLERRTYPNGGTGVCAYPATTCGDTVAEEGKTVYTRFETATGSTPDPVTGQIQSVAITTGGYSELVRSGVTMTTEAERHSFHGRPIGVGGTNQTTGGPAISINYGSEVDKLRGYPDGFEGKEYITEVPGLHKVQRVFGLHASGAGLLCQENTWLLSGTQVSARLHRYDRDSAGNPVANAYENLTDVYEYAFGAAPAIQTTTQGADIYYVCPSTFTGWTRRTHTDYLSLSTYTGQAVHLRSLPTRQEIRSSTATVAITETVYDDLAAAGYTCATAALGGLGGILQHDASFGTAYNTRGNPRCTARWRNIPTPAGWLVTRREFDIAGNVTSSFDPKGNPPTTFAYSVCPNTYALVSSVTNAAGHTTNYNWDCNISKPISVTDPNGQSSSLAYNDPLDRLTLVTRPAGGGATTYTYLDASRTIRSEVDLDTARKIKTEDVYDGLGRTVESRQYEDSGYIKTQREYDGKGRLRRVSNPYRGSSPDWTTTTYDALDRVTQITHPDNSTRTWTYTGDKTQMAQENSNKTDSYVDALGRLWKVAEAPNSYNYITTYAYNVLDNLTSVTQSGVSARTFTYDSLGRMTQSVNPESTTMNYTYDANGSLTQKSGGGAVIAYAYDVLNRVLSRSFTGGGGTYCYDGKSYSGGVCTGSETVGKRGRLTSAGNAESETHYDTFDAVGRVLTSRQLTASQTYTFSSQYNLNGGLSSVTYPSGRVVNYGYDGAGRPLSVSGQSPAATWVSQAQYAPQGGLSLLGLGSGLTEQRCYNNRLQTTLVRLRGAAAADCLTQSAFEAQDQWHLANGYFTGNNGNIERQTVSVPAMTPLLTVYRYDNVQRLTRVVERPTNATSPACPDSGSVWCLNYGYDSRGNRTITARTNWPVSPLEPTTFGSTNRITNTGWIYDTRGNITKNPLNETFVYDAEDRQVTHCTQDPGGCVNAAGAGRSLYRYDADGQRVKRESSTETTVWVYDAGGELAAEYSTAGSATAPAPGVYFRTSDHLDTTRVVTNGSGTVVERRDWEPFGGEILVGSTNPRFGVAGYGAAWSFRQQFTGKERDAETGLDYFEARYLSSAQGRFTSPDPVKVTPERLRDPQQFNLYAYARNNPLRFIDPTGQVLQLAGDVNEAQKQLCELLGTSDCGSRISYNSKTNTITVNVAGISNNEGALLLGQLVDSPVRVNDFETAGMGV